MTEAKIKNNQNNRTAQLLRNIKNKNNNIVRTTIPLTKEIKTKNK